MSEQDATGQDVEDITYASSTSGTESDTGDILIPKGVISVPMRMVSHDPIIHYCNHLMKTRGDATNSIIINSMVYGALSDEKYVLHELVRMTRADQLIEKLIGQSNRIFDYPLVCFVTGGR